jgi:ABC-type sugar transport system substrate-binding protein
MTQARLIWRARRSKRTAMTGLATASLGVALVLTGCGSSGSTASNTTTASTAGASSSTAAAPAPSTTAAATGGSTTTAAGGTTTTMGNTSQGTAQVVTQSGPTCTNPHPGGSLKGMLVGFSQSEALSNPFRAVETQSVEDEAKAMGAKIAYTNANADPAKQLSDIQDLLAQGVKALIIAPEDATGLQSALAQAQQKGVPVFFIDRITAGTVCSQYVTFAGSDFTQQGVRACTQLVQAMKGQANLLEIDGSPGNLVATQRKQGCQQVLDQNPGMKIVEEQTGNFTLSGGEQVTATALQAHPNINAIYAHNDEEALGAITAIDNAGKQPGTDIKIVSIDGTKAVIGDIVSGQVVADVETNPRFGPLIFGAMQDWFAGKPVHERLVTQDELYTASNAAQLINVQGY